MGTIHLRSGFLLSPAFAAVGRVPLTPDLLLARDRSVRPVPDRSTPPHDFAPTEPSAVPLDGGSLPPGIDRVPGVTAPTIPLGG